MLLNDGNNENNNDQNKVSKESENGENDKNDNNDNNVVEVGADDAEQLAHWGPQRPFGNEIPSSQPSILRITPGHTEVSSCRIRDPE